MNSIPSVKAVKIARIAQTMFVIKIGKKEITSTEKYFDMTIIDCEARTLYLI